MPLKTYKPISTLIPLGDSDSFGVRGLNSQDISILLSSNAEILEEMMNVLGDLVNVSTHGEVDVKPIDQKLGSALLHIAQSSPQFMCSVIALACVENQGGDDFAELMGVAAGLPAPTQIEAVMEIARLTFHEVGGIKKFISQASQFLGALKPRASLEA